MDRVGGAQASVSLKQGRLLFNYIERTSLVLRSMLAELRLELSAPAKVAGE